MRLFQFQIVILTQEGRVHKRMIIIGGLCVSLITAVIFTSRPATSIPPLPQTLSLSAAAYSVNEPDGTATITVLRSSADVNRVANVDLTTSAGTATAVDDYTETVVTVHFASGETTQDVAIPITDDLLKEADETVNITLSNAGGGGASLGDPAVAVLTIVNDDLNATCGNNAVELGETCDDGNGLDGDGCSVTCQTEACGDGAVNNNGTEQCDDGNAVDGDCCSATCQFEAAGSACDDGNVCSLTDECDGAGLCSGNGSTCGNGFVEGACAEQCDDGNAVNGDGCSMTCKTEICGDGAVNNNGAEQCDDGNVTLGDGCDDNCRTEASPAVNPQPTTEPPAADDTTGASNDEPAAPADALGSDGGGTGGCSLIAR